MKTQYLVEVQLLYILESYDDPIHVANNVYAQCSELAFSEDHLLSLEVSPYPLPPFSTGGTPDLRDPAPQQT